MLSSEMPVSENQKIFIHGFLNIKNTFFILYSVNDKAKNKETVYVNQLSAAMVALGTPILLTTFDEQKAWNSPIYFSTSPDKKSFAIAREYVEKGVTERIEIKAFNQNFTELYKTSIDVAAMQDLFVLSNVAITDNKNLYLFGQVDPRADNVVVFTGARNKAVPLVMVYNAKSKEIKPIVIAEPGIKEYYDYKFFLTRENEPFAISVYRSGKEAGYKICQIDNQSLSVKWKYSGIISPEAKSIASKYRSEKSFLDVVSFEKLYTGEYIFSMESNYVTSNRNQSFSNSGSIILVGLDKQGSKMWENIVYKQTRIADTHMHSSHQTFATNSGMLIVYNDNIQNLALAPGLQKFDKLKGLKKCMPTAIEVNAKGEMKKHAFVKGGETEGFALDTNHFLEIDKNMYQFKLSKYGLFSKFEMAYGKLEIAYDKLGIK
jgi:hypothetical protein